DATIRLPMSQIDAKARSLVYCRARQGCEHVIVLLGDAPVTVGRHRAQLSSGDEGIITDHDPKYLDLVGEDDIGRRGARLTPLPDNKTFTITEFSILDAIEREPLIYHLVHSDDARDRALKGRLMKTAAALNMVTFRHGPYSNGRR